MKITAQHYSHLEAQIQTVLAKNPDIAEIYATGQFPRADRVKDLQKRFCWDLFHAAGLTCYAVDHLYSYLNDDHIYTALRRICPTVTRNYS